MVKLPVLVLRRLCWNISTASLAATISQWLCRFCAGDVTIEAFQQQHLKLRQAYHERDIKRQAAEQTLM